MSKLYLIFIIFLTFLSSFFFTTCAGERNTSNTDILIVEDQIFSIDEGVNRNTAVGEVEVISNSGTVFFSIGSDSVNLPFNIEANSGKITTTDIIDFETTSSYILVVNVRNFTDVTDALELSTNVEMSINVNNIDPDTITLADQSFSVDENVPNNTDVGVIVATHSSDDVITSYVITAGNEDANFTINPTDGTISTVGDLDFEDVSIYTLTVEVSDGSFLTADTITININNLDEQIPMILAQSFTVDENIPQGSLVGVVLATDDIGVTQYSITGGNDPVTFSIDNDGNLITEAEIDYETTTSYTLTVEVQDAAMKIASADITIDVNDLDEQAPMISAQSFTVDEIIPQGSLVGVVLATDDVGVTQYSITGGNNPVTFSIDNDGNLMTTTALDYETTTSYTLTVEVQDAAMNINTADITVMVNDIDETIPRIIEGQVFSVNENKPDDTVVGTVIATDDVGIATYAITSGDDDSQFSIDNAGEITVNRMIDPDSGELINNIDYEKVTSFTLTIRVTDDDNKQATDTITINVNDVLDVIDLPIGNYNDRSIAVGNGYIYISGLIRDIDNDDPLLSQESFPNGILAFDLTNGMFDRMNSLAIDINLLESSVSHVTAHRFTGLTIFDNQIWGVYPNSNNFVASYSFDNQLLLNFTLENSHFNIISSGMVIVENKIWVTHRGGSTENTNRLIAFNTNDGKQDTSLGFVLHDENRIPAGVTWYDNLFWIVDDRPSDRNIFVYNMNGERIEEREFFIGFFISGIEYYNNRFYFLFIQEDAEVIFVLNTDGSLPSE